MPDGQVGVGESMTTLMEHDYTYDFPYLKYVDDRLYSKVMLEKTNTDAINGYGHIVRYSASAYVLVKVCKKCGLSQLDDFNDDRYMTCLRHKWESKLLMIGVGGGRTAKDAFVELEQSLSEFALGRGKHLFEQFDDIDRTSEMQSCGHPRSAIRGDGLTHWCAMCEEEA